MYEKTGPRSHLPFVLWALARGLGTLIGSSRCMTPSGGSFSYDIIRGDANVPYL